MKRIKITSQLFLSAVFAIAFFGFSAAAQGLKLPTDVGLPNASFPAIIEGLVRWLLLIFGFLAIISFLISGIMYLMAAGDEKSQEKAKRQMQYSIMGVIVGLVGLVVIMAVDRLLRGGGLG
ncbi:MAG: hypothetical protein QMD77_01215 [Patescibacteria group bacterium]|nr:hypothetical protein [Patescibacteria group bacterium]